jgi:hypothetical protein
MNNATNMHVTKLLPDRMTWIRLNRILAWALMVSPLIQLLFHTDFNLGFQINLGLFIAHGSLSLVLFGAPQNKWKGFNAMMHVLGGRPERLSARNRFLLSGYRVALGLTPVLLIVLGFPSGIAFIFTLPFLYPVLRLPVSAIEHIDSAVAYALQRMRWSKSFATPVLFLYLFFTAMNIRHGFL